MMRPQSILVKTIYGSKLYGTDTVNSDTDYKGIFMPTLQQVILHKGPQTVNYQSCKTGLSNTAGDIDTEFYSFPYFVELALRGQTVALDLLHTPLDKTLNTSPVWKQLVANRHRFYTSSMKAFVGYAKSQSVRLCAKGPRLNFLRFICSLVKGMKGSTLLKEYWDFLPVGEYSTKQVLHEGEVSTYTVCGRSFQSTSLVKNMVVSLDKMSSLYGDRAKGSLDGADWKAMSHALRAAFEVLEIYKTHDLKFPLNEASYLKEVRAGEYSLEDVSKRLEDLVYDIEAKSLTVDLPKVPDERWAGQFVCDTVLEWKECVL